MGSKLTADQIVDEHASRSRDAHGRRGLAFIASVAAHALVLVALVFLVPEVERPHHDWVLAYLVEFGRPGTPGRGAGASDARASSPPASAPDEASAATPQTPHPARRGAARAQAQPTRAAPQTAAIAAAPVPGAAAIAARSGPVVPATAGTTGPHIDVVSASSVGPGSHRGGADGGSGGGGWGDGSGSGSADVEYAQNPVPIYPIEARRRAQQGTVLLRIEVGVDGSVERVEIAQSSGFDSLDRSAVETVRRRWRFVPAERAGIAIESWCQVPIRFALTEARAN
jgi:protein TonB